MHIYNIASYITYIVFSVQLMINLFTINNMNCDLNVIGLSRDQLFQCRNHNINYINTVCSTMDPLDIGIKLLFIVIIYTHTVLLFYMPVEIINYKRRDTNIFKLCVIIFRLAFDLFNFSLFLTIDILYSLYSNYTKNYYNNTCSYDECNYNCSITGYSTSKLFYILLLILLLILTIISLCRLIKTIYYKWFMKHHTISLIDSDMNVNEDYYYNP